MSFKQDMGAAEEMVRQIKANKEQYFQSRFGFLNETHGLRLGCYHALLGTTGSGKSTIAQAIAADSLESKKVLLILSEDRFKEYQIGIKLSNSKYNHKNLMYFEQESAPKEVRKYSETLFDYYSDLIAQSGAQLVIWDNPTTSHFASFTFREQEAIVYNFRLLAQRLNMAFMHLVHTKKEITDNMGRLIEGEDVRGSNQVFQLADYFYIFQKFMLAEKFYPFVRIKKHRYHRFIKQFYHGLCYKDGAYVSDFPVEFKAINEAFLKRNYLGRKP